MKKKEQKLFLEAVKAFEQEKGISSEILLDALNESFKFAFQKKIEKENFFDKKTGKSLIKVDKNAPKLPDALVRVDIDLDKARIKCFRQWLVLEDDDITDDYIDSLPNPKEKFDYSEPMTSINFKQKNQIAGTLIGIFANENINLYLSQYMKTFSISANSKPILFGSLLDSAIVDGKDLKGDPRVGRNFLFKEISCVFF